MDYSKIFEYVLMDNPEIFYVREISMQFEPLTATLYFVPKYLYSKQQIQQYTTQIYNFRDKICSRYAQMDDFQKEKQIHDLLCKNVVYEDYGDLSHTALGLILYKKGVCDGFAKLAKLLFDGVGICSYVVSSQAFGINQCYEPHAWNIVKIEGKWYHLDITFDRTTSTDNIRYDYFNLTDTDISSDHIYNSGEYDACNSMAYNYFHYNNLIMHTKQQLEDAIQDKIKNKQNYIQFKIPISKSSEDFTEQIQKVVAKSLGKLALGYSYSLSPNEKQHVYEVSWKRIGL